MTNLLGKSPRILVIGDLMIDQYLWGTSERISPESPVPIVSIDKESSILGGAGNVINNLKVLGANIDIISVLGDCSNSIELKKMLENIEVNTKYLVTEKNRLTSKKSRIISSHQQVARYDLESKHDIDSKSQNKILRIINKIISNYEVILISDYGKGVLTTELTKSLIKLANENSIKTLVDPKGNNFSKYNGAFILTPNVKEASEATRINISGKGSLKKAIIQLKSEHSLGVSLVTLSEGGVAVYDDKFRVHPTHVKEVFDVTGAGDTVLAALGFSIACGFDIDDAVKFANRAAGVVVSKIGSATASINEIINYTKDFKEINSKKNILSYSEIITTVEKLKRSGNKIILSI